MRLFRIPLVVALTLGLAGCNVTTAVPTPSISSLVPSEIKNAVTASCGVVLSSQSLSTVVGLFVPGVQSVQSYAAEICGSMTRLLAAAPGGGTAQVTGMFRGQRISGVRVR